MKITSICIVLIILFSVSCIKTKPLIHKDLLGFKAIFIAELGDKEYDGLESKLGKLQVRHIEDIIYVSTYAEVNACGDYLGNIQIRNDTILLTYDYISDMACASVTIDKLTYLIDNPNSKKRKIKFEH